MAVFRIDKTKDYTVMANHHLRNKALSLKAKGLLSLMLSLPENWDYTTKGLSRICKDGVDSIGSTIRELEKAGYVRRQRIRDAHGRLTEIEYTILEKPEACLETPERGNPVLDYPDLGIPEQAAPEQDNPAQLNIQVSNPQRSNKKGLNTHSFFPSSNTEEERKTDGQIQRENIKKQIQYESIDPQYDRAQVDELIEIILEVFLNRSPSIKIGRDAEYPIDYVKQRFRQINAFHIEKVLAGIQENTTRVWNTKAYLLAALFNVTSTLDTHYAMLVNHELHASP